MKFQNLLKDVIGVRNPYGLIQQAGKQTRHKSRNRNKARTKSRNRNKSLKKQKYTK